MLKAKGCGTYRRGEGTPFWPRFAGHNRARIPQTAQVLALSVYCRHEDLYSNDSKLVRSIRLGVFRAEAKEPFLGPRSSEPLYNSYGTVHIRFCVVYFLHERYLLNTKNGSILESPSRARIGRGVQSHLGKPAELCRQGSS